MSEIEKIPVVSSNIEAIGYDEDTSTLRVWFSNGSTYEYSNVPVLEFEQLKLAPSIGSYLARNIKGNYPYSRVE